MDTAGSIQAYTQERALLWCLLASIALHALVLLAMSRYELPAPSTRTLLVLTAKLAPYAAVPQTSVKAQEPAVAPARVPRAVAAPGPAPSKPVVSSAAAAPPAAPAQPAKAIAPEHAPGLPAAADAETPATAPTLARAAPQPPAGIPGAEASSPAGHEADAGTLEQYRMALIVATRRYKRYPAIAMEKGWQGRVEVRMVIGASGTLASASVKTSSGHEVLDSQAIHMLNKGKAAVPIPPGLRGREFNVDVPVIFNLDNPNS